MSVELTRAEWDLVLVAMACLVEHDMAIENHAKERKCRRAVRLFKKRRDAAAQLQVKIITGRVNDDRHQNKRA